MKYICADGIFISSLIIFKEANLCKDWIAVNVSDDWHLSCNTKKWISNEYDMKWMKQLFESMTREKANDAKWLLICDDHDNHISLAIIYHCITNDIVLMLLSLYISYLMQSLDVDVFDSMKFAIMNFLDHLDRIDIMRI